MARIALFFLAVFSIVVKNQAILDTFSGGVGNIQTVANFATDANGVAGGSEDPSALILGSGTTTVNTILDVIIESANLIADLTSGQDRMVVQIDRMMDRLPLLLKIQKAMHELHAYVVRVDFLYGEFDYYIFDSEDFSNDTLYDWINSVTSTEPGGLPDILHRMSRLALPMANLQTSIFELISKDIWDNIETLKCGTNITNQDRLWQLYNSIMITEMRGFLMATFAYDMLITYTNESMNAELFKIASNLVLRAERYIESLKGALENHYYWIEQCAPGKLIKGENYVSLNSLTGILAVEPDYTWDALCDTSCPYMWVGNGAYRCTDDSVYCPRKRCGGQIWGCVFMGDTRWCELPSEDDGRYQSLQSYGQGRWGNFDSCGGRSGTAKSWTSWRLNDCAVCFCHCSEQGSRSTATRFINLMPQMSNIEENMVITGVQIVKQDNMIQLQVKEGVLLGQGRINDTTAQWVTLETLTIDDSREPGGVYKTVDGNKQYLDYSKDYGMIYRHQTRMFFDRIEVPQGYVMTGVRFSHEKEENVGVWNTSPLRMEIHATDFDYYTGKLGTESKWVTADNMENKSEKYDEDRSECSADTVDYPERNENWELKCEANKYIDFTATDLYKDVRAHTVPFFDSRPVEMPNSVALSGIEMIYFGQDGYGGVLSLRIYTIDIRNYVSTQMSEEAAVKYKNNGRTRS